jgi:hypothetical protein
LACIGFFPRLLRPRRFDKSVAPQAMPLVGFVALPEEADPATAAPVRHHEERAHQEND